MAIIKKQDILGMWVEGPLGATVSCIDCIVPSDWEEVKQKDLLTAEAIHSDAASKDLLYFCDMCGKQIYMPIDRQG